MKFKQIKSILIRFIGIIFFSQLVACGGGSSDPETIEPVNNSPVAKITSDRLVATVGQVIKLSAQTSTDADNDPLLYAWTIIEKPQGSDAHISFDVATEIDFIGDLEGTYRIGMKASDGSSSSETTVVLTISNNNNSPIANAGLDQNVSLQEMVWLDGSDSSDEDGQPLSYRWQFVQTPSEETAVLNNSESVSPNFPAAVSGVYEIELVVNDGEGDSLPDIIRVIVSEQNSTPIAHAGDDQFVTINNLITLDGGLSSDAENVTLTYLWEFTQKPQDSGAVLSSQTAMKPTFNPDKQGIYTLSLVVSDGQSTSEQDFVEINVNSENNPPTANAGSDQQVYLNETVYLDASNSSDAEGDSLNYSWTFISKPNNSNSSLSDSSTITPSFTVDMVGDYVLKVLVSDSNNDSSSDNVVVTVIEENTLLTGLVTGMLVNSQNQPLAGAQLVVDGNDIVTNQSGVFSTVVQVAKNDTVLVETNDPTLPYAYFVSDKIIKNNGQVNYDFVVNLNSQTMPVFQTISVNLFSCFSTGQGNYSGASDIEVQFSLTEHESSLFTIDYQNNQILPVDGSLSFQLPAYSEYQASINDFLVAGIDAIFNNTVSITHYTEGSIATLTVCDIN